MKSWRISDSFSIDALSLDEVAAPTPGPREAVVRVRAVSLNYRDLLVVKGLYSRKVPLPLTIASDCAGEVESVGTEVRGLRVGDRVCPAFMPAWRDGDVDESKARSALGAFAQGVLAERVCFHEDALVRFPAHMGWEEAATLPCAGVTAWHALREGAGHWVLTQGSGGVSVFALQIAKAMGSRVIATSSSEAKMARLAELGADHTINYVAAPDWEEQARKLAGGRGVDHVVEVGGPATFNKSVRAVRMGGRVSLIGNRAAGGGANDVNLTSVLMKGVRVQGIFVGSREMFDELCAFAERHALRPVVDRVFDFDSAPEALHYFETGSHFGKVCIRVQP
jgi:NADPH:quinone reductase-like Zn-dependent oxidoreductase